MQQVAVGVPVGVGVPPGVPVGEGVGAGDGDVGVAVGLGEGAEGTARNTEGAGGSSYFSRGSVGSGLCGPVWPEVMAKAGSRTREVTAAKADRRTKRQTFFMPGIF